MPLPLLRIVHEVSPGEGEDSFTLRGDENGAFLCVTDGCGGLGSRRYASLKNRTGAYLAARLAARAFAGFALETGFLPDTPEEGMRLGQGLGEALDAMLGGFSKERLREDTPARIVGSMQRCLPSTLCGAFTRPGAAGWRELCFLWAGDSRGYVLDQNGLHQCTGDHLRGHPDAFESLYRDAPLSNLVSADRPARMSLRRLRASQPGVILVATDGAYSALPTPMEFEFLLLNTLHSAKSWKSWERCLTNRLGKIAQDDATMLLEPCGALGFEALQEVLAPRRAFLQKNFITPVRRRRQDIAFAREAWRLYQPKYDWTEGGSGGRMDWRI